MNDGVSQRQTSTGPWNDHRRGATAAGASDATLFRERRSQPVAGGRLGVSRLRLLPIGLMASSSTDDKVVGEPTAVIGAPSHMTKLGSLVQQVALNEWLVAGEQVPAFLYVNGPASITCYNFNQVRGRWVDKSLVLIQPHQQHGKPDTQDVLSLCPAGASECVREHGGLSSR